MNSVTRILLKHLINLELLSVYLPFTFTCMFPVSINSNVLHIPPRFFISHSIDICSVAIKSIRKIHALSTNQIADILYFHDNNVIQWNLPKADIL